MIKGKGEKDGSNGDNNSSNTKGKKTRSIWIASATALSLAAFLIFAAPLSSQSPPYGASAATPAGQAAKTIGSNNDHAHESSAGSTATANQRQQQYWQDFLTLERESWHYNYNNAEKQNVKAYQKWYCADLRLHGYQDFAHACDLSSYPKDAMWQQEQLRDEILWNKANHQPHHEIKKTDWQLKHLQERADMRDNMTLHGKADDRTWRHYLSLEKQAWHYDYARTEPQNLKAFHAWWSSSRGEEPDKMWFSEQHGHEILWDKAAGAGKDGINNVAPKGLLQSWFGEAYHQHKAEIAKNGCVDPWERTPDNAAPSWSACLDAKSPPSAHQEKSM